MDFGRDFGHTPVMDTAQRLPVSLTPLDAALVALLRDLGPVARRDAKLKAPSCAVEMPDLKAWPPHDIAGVDGWALRASDLVGASGYTPLPLNKPPIWVEAGDRIPEGCDCVLDEDWIDRAGPIAQAMSEAVPGQGIRRKGEAFADEGRMADAWRSGFLLGSARSPRLRVVNVFGGAISSKLMAGGLREAGIEMVFVEARKRDRASIAKLLDGSDCDLLLVVGGSGVGRTDATVAALAERGEVVAHGLALQPGRTAAIGRIGRAPVIVVPGAPDQALAVCWTLVLPALERLAGRRRQTVRRPLSRKIASSVGIAEVVLLGERDGAWAPLSVGDLPLAAVSRADAWLLVPGGSEGYAAGTEVDAYMLRQ